MKKIILLAAICIITVKVFSQGSGEITVYPNHFYHGHQNYGEIKNLTIKWNFRTLFGEPVIDGVFKWEAGSNTPSDFLDYRDYVLLKCAPVKMSVANGHILSFYIAIAPTVPRAGEGYGFNTPGSPSWNDVFIHSLWEKRQGENKYRLDINYLPYKTVGDYAKAIWKEGFKVIDAELVRAGGLDADKTTKSNTSSDNDFWNTPENTTTQNDLKQKEAIDRQKQLTQQAKDKYNALKKPFAFEEPAQNSSFNQNVIIVKGFVNNYFLNKSNEFILNLNGVEQNVSVDNSGKFSNPMVLAAGVNKIKVSILANGFRFKDSLNVFYTGEKTRIRATLTWNTNYGDLDLHMIAPNGQSCSFRSKKINGMSLDVDDTSGFGPENISMVDGQNGKYSIQVVNYSSSDNIEASVYIFINEVLKKTLKHVFSSSDKVWDVTTIEYY